MKVIRWSATLLEFPISGKNTIKECRGHGKGEQPKVYSGKGQHFHLKCLATGIFIDMDIFQLLVIVTGNKHAYPDFNALMKILMNKNIHKQAEGNFVLNC